jgi:hypothetical protein
MKASFCSRRGKTRGGRRKVSEGRKAGRREGETHPVSTEHPTSEVHPNSGDHTRFSPKESVVEQRNLHEELAQRPRLKVVIVGLGDPPHPRVRAAVTRDVELEALEDNPLATKDLVATVSALGHVNEFLDGGSHDLLVLGGDEHGGDTDELELDKRDDAVREETVDEVDGDPEGFGEHVVTHVDLEEPIDERRSHGPVDERGERGGLVSRRVCDG